MLQLNIKSDTKYFQIQLQCKFFQSELTVLLILIICLWDHPIGMVVKCLLEIENMGLSLNAVKSTNGQGMYEIIIIRTSVFEKSCKFPDERMKF